MWGFLVGLGGVCSVLQEDDLVVHLFWGFGFGCGFESFYALFVFFYFLV